MNPLAGVEARSLEESYEKLLAAETQRIVKKYADMYGVGKLTPDIAMGAWGALYHLRQVLRTLHRNTLDTYEMVEEEMNG